MRFIAPYIEPNQHVHHPPIAQVTWFAGLDANTRARYAMGSATGWTEVMPTRAKVLAAAITCVFASAATVPLTTTAPAFAANDSHRRAYDDKLLRLTEILGALHYLRELCDGKDGQRWRSSIEELVRSEGKTALRRATIAKRFNLGYRGYRRSYRRCTPSARSTIERFFKESIELSEQLIKLAD